MDLTTPLLLRFTTSKCRRRARNCLFSTMRLSASWCRARKKSCWRMKPTATPHPNSLSCQSICLQVDIDPKQLSDLVTETVRTEVHGAPTQRALFVGSTNDQLTDALLRLARLLDTPRDIPLLAPMVIREIYYRLLNGSYGQRIAQIVIKGTNMQRIAHVIQMLKRKLSEPIRVEDLAEMAHMSPSSFHAHFKELTAMSPLQYQKRLRLLEARRLLLVEGTDAASAAYRVGYGSASQFSREYSRMFGAPPK